MKPRNPENLHPYRCKHCGKIIRCDSVKQWIQSYCAATGQKVLLILQEKEQA